MVGLRTKRTARELPEKERSVLEEEDVKKLHAMIRQLNGHVEMVENHEKVLEKKEKELEAKVGENTRS